MIKQRQLALNRQRSLVKSSVCSIQQNDLAVAATRLPDYGHRWSTGADETAVSCAELAAADVAKAVQGYCKSPIGLSRNGGLSPLTDVFGDRPQTGGTSLADELVDVPARSPTCSAAQVAPERQQPQAAPSKGRASACWGGAIQLSDASEDVQPEPVPVPAEVVQERSAQGRKFWRPWKSSKRSVSIVEPIVETHASKVASATDAALASLVTAFAEGGNECDSLDMSGSFSSCGPSLRCLASIRGRASTPWEATPGGMNEEDSLELGLALPGAMQDRPLSRVQAPTLPIMPRTQHQELQDSWGSTNQPAFQMPMPPQLPLKARNGDDSAPRNLSDATEEVQCEAPGEALRAILSQEILDLGGGFDPQLAKQPSNRTRMKLW